MDEPSAIVAVLAGGRARRMGGAKATAELGGGPLISHPLAAARATGAETIVIAKPGTPLPAITETVVLDTAAAAHPLHGVLAALDFAVGRGAPAVVLVACDMPFVTASMLTWLVGLEGAAMVEAGGGPQPLLSRLPTSGRPLIAGALAEGASVLTAILATGPRILDDAEVAAFGDPARLCFNVNDAEDLRRAGELFE